MKGRKPKPSHLRLVAGNPGRRPLNKAEPKVARSRPSAPAHVSDLAREAWGYLSATLDRMGVLTEVDAVALEGLCEAYADMREARRALREHGARYYETVNKDGGIMIRPHPALGDMQDADRRIRAWVVEFGMTPSARSRVKADGSEEEDEADKFFA